MSAWKSDGLITNGVKTRYIWKRDDYSKVVIGYSK